MFRATLLSAFLLAAVPPAFAGAGEPLEPIVWPVVRYGWPEKLSAGVAVQPPLAGGLGSLLGTFTLGMGGMKGGLGIGTFGGNCMTGASVQLTMLRTGANPLGAAPHETFLGIEAEVMFGNISFKGGPAFRVGGRAPADGRSRVNFGIGYGF
jgi:hypothetical protein